MDTVINLDKPKGITSHDAVMRVKRLMKTRRVGHAGTLDPMATGVLVICVGEATKFVSMITDMDKQYLAVMKLGQRTDTYDAEGAVTAEAGYGRITREAALEVIGRYLGRTMQMPPMYSAIKQNGTPLYELARQGIEVQRPRREIVITELELTSFEPPYIGLSVTCGKGTYIRSLIDDIGEALGCHAHMTELRRTRVGSFKIEASALPDEILQKTYSCCTIDQALIQLPQVALTGLELTRALNGGAVKCSTGAGLSDGQLVRISTGAGRFLGVGMVAGGVIKMQRMLQTGGKT